ncbi:hypothetical protein B0H19DRAFT_1075142 [Mycena capillaripes]|nr:hypothetical protein B0H19DRAFT_1075142 [Mycena capillaripes]
MGYPLKANAGMDHKQEGGKIWRAIYTALDTAIIKYCQVCTCVRRDNNKRKRPESGDTKRKNIEKRRLLEEIPTPINLKTTQGPSETSETRRSRGKGRQRREAHKKDGEHEEEHRRGAAGANIENRTECREMIEFRIARSGVNSPRFDCTSFPSRPLNNRQIFGLSATT